MAEGPSPSDFSLSNMSARMSVPDTFFTVQQKSKCIVKQHTMITLNETVEEDDSDRRFECSVCLGEYEDSGNGVPRSLLCGHTFCTGCLTDLLKESVISCPKCKHVTPISCHGVQSTLVKNYGVLEIMYTHSSLSSSNKMKQLSMDGSSEALSMSTDIPICTIHGDRLTSFCVKDRVLVCSTCLLYGAHKDHPCQLVMDAGAECRQNMKRLLPDLRTRTDQMKSTVIDIQKIVEDVQCSCDALGDHIEAYFNRLVQVLEERKRELKVEVMHRTQERVEALVEQSCSLSKAIEHSEDCLDKITTLLSYDNHTLLQDYGPTRDKILQLFIDSVPIEPVACNNLCLKFPPDDVLEEFKAQFSQHVIVQAELGIVENLMCDSFHDGFRIHWKNKNFVDSDNCTYRVQVATPTNNNYTVIYQGGDTKFTYRNDDLQYKVGYKFRVRVQTIESVGGWCEPIECCRAQPGWLWDKRRRNIKIEVTNDCLQASSRHSSCTHWASVSGNKVFHHGVFYTEIEVIDLAKHHIHKKWFTKIALGVLQCSDAVANEGEWQEGVNPIGRLTLIRSSSIHHSWGYIPTSGVKVSTSTDLKEEPYREAVTLAVGDRIGMLVNINEQEPSSISFFINNTDLGVAYSNLTPPLLPVLSVCDKFSVRLRFPPPPYINRNPSMTHDHSSS